MELKDAILQRKSIRGYESKPVPEDKLNTVLEAARMAPSGGNRQPWKFVVVRDEEKRKRLSEASGGQGHVAEAPVVIAAVGTMPENMMMCDVPGYPVDLSIAVDHMTLAAVDEGLGTCWIGAFKQEKARDILGVPKKCKIVALLTLGFPRDTGRPKDRKPLEEIVCYDTYK
ncbi:MAG: nitroreductase family protein [Dehalococcoidales bacterium]|nr:MAG: nitroreductase family protein [Dehalococcoidales bacterium]